MRRLAFSAVGDRNSPDVLLCLPVLLETRATFDPLLKAFSKGSNVARVSSRTGKHNNTSGLLRSPTALNAKRRIDDGS